MDLDGDGDEDVLSLNINKDFASKYETKKRGEELSKLQDKYGKDYVPSDGDENSESESDDDEEAEFVTPQVDVAILKTLARIKARDPAVYDSSRAIFDEEEASVPLDGKTGAKTSERNKSKPVLLKDYQRKRLLEDPTGTHEDSVAPTPLEKQERLKEETKKAFLGAVSDDEDDHESSGAEDDLLIRKDKSEKERKREEQEYSEFLKTSAGQQALEAALDKDEQFLNNYILNRGWVDKDDKRPSHLDDDEAFASDDSEFEDRAEKFETAYNFRFENPDAAAVVTHSRSVPSVRKPTTQQSARARARQAQKEREEEEKVRRKEEVRRLKALKRKEIEDKLVQLAEAAGEGASGLDAIDLEGDWDEAAHDAAMRKVYGSDYEDVADKGFKPRKLPRDGEEGEDDDDGKPTWDDDIDISDLQIPEVDDDEAAGAISFGDAHELATGGEDGHEVADGKKAKKGKKRKRDGEEFDPDLVEAAKGGDDDDRKAVVDGLLDSYYEVDYEDKIGDLKTRFKYTNVAPSTYGLSPVEILLATDAELNQFMSLRKLAPYRAKDDKKSRKRLHELRSKLRTREWGKEPPDESTSGGGVGQADGGRDKKRRKQDRSRERPTGDGDGAAEPKEKKKRKGRKERARSKAGQSVAVEE